MLPTAPCPTPTPREETGERDRFHQPSTCDITAWGKGGGKSSFAAPETQAMVISRLSEDPRLLEGKLKFGDDTLAIKDSINILGVKVDSRLRFDRHLETVGRRASLRVTLRAE
ncbi:hypothetical protein GWK47_046184 [Chionoecetes opilio]|uniref:Uncharacterized protein n=1 Tax=Chionoecetes opilio TaxID=41210 RepID=A0A8J5CXA8_CHIOP|nr:hypothetical protein GWK47_046184 [Chionoecetes opilio]